MDDGDKTVEAILVKKEKSLVKQIDEMHEALGVAEAELRKVRGTLALHRGVVPVSTSRKSTRSLAIDILRGGPMGVPELHDEIKLRGVEVGQGTLRSLLSRDEAFESTERGVWTLAKK